MDHELRKYLTRYWIEFEDSLDHESFRMLFAWGCGVTAFTYQHALQLLQDNVFAGHELPGVRHVIEDVKLDQLDQNHVIPNIGDVSILGVWWPPVR